MFHDEQTPETQRLASSLVSDFAVVPALWPTEVVNALLMAERRKRITPSESRQYMSILETLDIRVQEAPSFSSLNAIQDVARRHTLTANDALYLEAAKREGLPLATLDEELARAAQAEGVALAL